MEFASLAQHANLIIQFWLSLRTMAWPHLLWMYLILLSPGGYQMYNHLRHLLLNYQVTTSFSILMQKLLQKIHPNKMILHWIPSRLPQSLYTTKLLEVWFFFLLDILFSPTFSGEVYHTYHLFPPFSPAILWSWIVCSEIFVTTTSLWGMEGIFCVE